MKDPQEITEQKLIMDESFIAWVYDLDDSQKWDQWLRNNPDKHEVAYNAREFILSMSFKPETISNEAVTKLHGALRRKMEDRKMSNEGFSRSLSSRFSPMRWAAVISAIAVISIILFNFSETSAPVESQAVDLSEKYAPKGRKLTIRLEDGSTVKLNSDSRLSFPPSFDEAQREVYLEGEAFFEVTKDKKRPFVVHSGQVKTRVLGTSFNIKAYKNSEDISVAVLTGQVAVEEKDTPHSNRVTLHPNQILSFNRSNRQLKVQELDHQLVMGWVDGLLTFDKAEFEEIVLEIERWYGVSITALPSVKVEERFSARYDRMTLEGVLEGLSFALGLEYEIQGNNVTIKQSRSM